MNLLLMQQAAKFFGIPRNGLILAMDGYRDTYGRNIMPAGSDDFVTWWTINDGAVRTITQNQTVTEWGTNTATRITMTAGNGTSLLKYYMYPGLTSIIGNTYPISCYVKNIGTNSITVRNNISPTTITIASGENKKVVIDSPSNVVGQVHIQFRADVVTNGFDIITYHPQINLGQLFDYSPPAGLPANPLDYYRGTNVQNGSAVGGDSNDIAGYTGVGWQMNTASNFDNYFKIAKGGNFDNLNYATCITVANALGAGGSNFGRIHDKASGSALTGHLSYLDANRKLTFSRYNGVSNFKQWVANDTPAWGTNNVLITRFEKALNDDSAELMVNGVNQSMSVSSGGTPTIVDDANFDLYLGNRVSMDRHFLGNWYQHFWYNRILTDQECVLATKNIKSVLNTRGVVING